MHPDYVAKMVAICEERFWSKVEKRGPDDCWIWTGQNSTSGYGSYKTLGGSMRSASREAYEMTHGPQPQHFVVCHRCDNRLCCNPAHLFLGTVADNNRDRDRKGRQVAPRGEQHTRATITEATVRAIRADYVAGIHPKNIATTYGVTHAVAYQVATRRTWRHLP